MVKNVVLKYPNHIEINTHKLCSYEIVSLKKRYLLYTLNEVEGENVIVYFGQLITKENQLYMENVNNEDLNEFKKFLVSLATGSLDKNDGNYISTSLELEQKTIIVTGGGKTKIKDALIEPYLHGIEKVEEIEELNFDDDIEVIPATEPVDKKEEPIKPEQVEEAKEEPISETPKENVEEMEEPTKSEQIEEVKEESTSQIPKENVEEIKEEKKVVEEPKIEEQKEKKKNPFLSVLIFLLVLLVIGGLLVGGYFWIKENNRKADEKEPIEETPLTLSLEQIGQKMRSGSFVQELTSQGKDILITTTSSEIVFKITSDDDSIEYRYVLKGNVLYTTILTTDEIAQELTQHIYAAIQELLGNDRNEVLKQIKNGFENPTLNVEGIAITEENESLNIQISTNTKLNLNEVIIEGPIEIGLLNGYKEDLTSDKFLMLQYGNVSLLKKMDETLELTIIEKGTLGQNAYQSILNYLVTAFDEEAMNTFKENYTGFELGDSEYSNYTIVLNEPLDSDYESLYPSTDYQWVTVKINKDMLK